METQNEINKLDNLCRFKGGEINLGRKSKYSSDTVNINHSQKIWNTGIYIRLSQEDDDKIEEKMESNSVTSQRNLLNEFIENHGELTLYDIYIDDRIYRNRF